MTETTCAKCGARAESHWRIRLEHESPSTSEATPYRLCRECWDGLRGRFSPPDSRR